MMSHLLEMLSLNVSFYLTSVFFLSIMILLLMILFEGDDAVRKVGAGEEVLLLKMALMMMVLKMEE